MAVAYATAGDIENAFEYYELTLENRFNPYMDLRLFLALSEVVEPGNGLDETLAIFDEMSNVFIRHPDFIQAGIKLYERAGNETTAGYLRSLLWQYYPAIASEIFGDGAIE